MSPEVEIALIVAISSLTSPLILSYFTGRQIRRSKQQDYAREDAVAAQAAEAARLLLEQQTMAADKAAEAATLLLASNERVAANAQVTLGKLDVIHTLVNSSLTSAMQSELDATISQVALMKEVAALHRSVNKDDTTTTTTTAEALAALEIAEKRVAELKLGLDDRRKQTIIASKQEKDEATKAAEKVLDDRRRGEDLGR